MPSRFCITLAMFSAASLLLGCTGGSTPVAKVSGVVKYKDKELTSGMVTFHGPKDRTAAAGIGANGQYECNNAPVGENKISVAVLAPGAVDTADDPGKIAPKGGPPAFSSPIPEKFADPEKSGLKLEVKSGSQTHDIILQ